MRKLLEERAARLALPTLDEDALERIASPPPRLRGAAADAGDVAGRARGQPPLPLRHPRRRPNSPHTMRIIRLLWDSTEAYRAIYYNSPLERRAVDRRARADPRRAAADDADALIAELDAHRERALRGVLREILREQA